MLLYADKETFPLEMRLICSITFSSERRPSWCKIVPNEAQRVRNEKFSQWQRLKDGWSQKIKQTASL
jgi:hypothetical protein